jgi:hypothetical protein
MTSFSRHDEAAAKSRRHDIPGRSACGPLSEHFQPSADKSLPLKHEYFLFGDQEDRCAAGRNCHCIRECLFAAV